MFLSVVTFLIVLSVLVLVHEAGHFFAARRAGILVEEFGFGIPPRVLGKKIGETIYSLNLLPFGGFVRLHGENTEDEITKPERAFLNKNKKTRSIIILAGVIMNFVLAIVAFSIVYSMTGIPRQTENVRLLEVVEGSPAESAGFEEGDIIRDVNGEKITTTDQFIGRVEENKGTQVSFALFREGKVLVVNATPRLHSPEDEGALGVVITSTENYFPPLWQRPFVGVYYGFKEAVFWGGVVISGFIKIFKDLFVGVVPEDVAGPVGIFALTSEAAKFGILPLINFLGVLSVNLAILNVIPFPALDGGRLLFIGIESFFGRRVVPKVENIIHTIGMIILILLILAITASDIKKLVNEGGVAGYIESVLK